MIDLTGIASTALAFFIVTASPGPATISCATVAMSRGRKTGLLHGLGLSVGLGFWGVVAACGMGMVLQGSIYLLMVLKLLGGLYLLRLALITGRAALSGDPQLRVPADDRQWFVGGLLLNLSNPKAVFAWMAALSVGLNINDGIGTLAVATLVCIATGFASYTLYAVLFSVGGVMRGYRRFYRLINSCVAGIFALAGLGLIRSAFSSQS